MKKIFFIIGIIGAMTIAAIAANNSTYIHSKIGNLLSFNDADIDSITLSRVDENGVVHDGYVTQIIHSKDSVYISPISSIESITFTKPKVTSGDYGVATCQEVDLGLSVNWAGYN